MSRPTAIAGDLNAIVEALAPKLAALLIKIIPSLSEQMKAQTAEFERLSGEDVRRLAKCRRELVTAALNSGALPGKREGTRWAVTADDARIWIKHGCKEMP